MTTQLEHLEDNPLAITPEQLTPHENHAMTHYRVYAILDGPSRYFPERPFFVRTLPEAIRAVANAARPGSAWASHPHDYKLFELGTYDALTGRLIPHDTLLDCGSVYELTGARAQSEAGKGEALAMPSVGEEAN